PLATHGWTIHPGQSRLSGPMPSMSVKDGKADVWGWANKVSEVPGAVIRRHERARTGYSCTIATKLPPDQAAGLMFWLMLKKFVGFFFFSIGASRKYFGPNAVWILPGFSPRRKLRRCPPLA